MAAFVVRRDTALPVPEAWQRLTDWPRHARYVPLTSIHVRTPPPTSAGTVFVARTALGRLGFDDPMEVVEWQPPRFCRLEKRGRVLHGWAELRVDPHRAGSRVSWQEEAVPARLPRAAAGFAAAAGRLLFGRLLRRLLDEPR